MSEPEQGSQSSASRLDREGSGGLPDSIPESRSVSKKRKEHPPSSPTSPTSLPSTSASASASGSVSQSVTLSGPVDGASTASGARAGGQAQTKRAHLHPDTTFPASTAADANAEPDTDTDMIAPDSSAARTAVHTEHAGTAAEEQQEQQEDVGQHDNQEGQLEGQPERLGQDSQRRPSPGHGYDGGDRAYFLPSFIEDPWAHLRVVAQG